MRADLRSEVDAYLAEFRRVNGDAHAPREFDYRNGWLSFRHYGVTHRQRRAWLTRAVDNLKRQPSA